MNEDKERPVVDFTARFEEHHRVHFPTARSRPLTAKDFEPWRKVTEEEAAEQVQQFEDLTPSLQRIRERLRRMIERTPQRGPVSIGKAPSRQVDKQ